MFRILWRSFSLLCHEFRFHYLRKFFHFTLSCSHAWPAIYSKCLCTWPQVLQTQYSSNQNRDLPYFIIFFVSQCLTFLPSVFTLLYFNFDFLSISWICSFFPFQKSSFGATIMSHVDDLQSANSSSFTSSSLASTHIISLARVFFLKCVFDHFNNWLTHVSGATYLSLN